MRRLYSSIFAVVIGVGAAARGQDLNTARIALDSAERRMSGASIDAINARRELDFALTNQRQAADAARNAADSIDQVRLVMDDPSMIDRALADARAAAEQVAVKDSAHRDARARLDAASQRMDGLRSQARTGFERGEQHVQAVNQRDLAEARLAGSEDLALRLLEENPDYQQLVLMAEYARTRVEQLRNGGSAEQATIARASEFWINAQSDVGTYEQWWLENDDSVLTARQSLSEARMRVAEIDRRFEAQLAADPQFIEHAAMRDAQQREVARAAAALQEARAAQRQADLNAAAMRDRLVLARQQYDRLLAELAASQAALDQAATSAFHADRTLRDVLDRQDRAMMERDRAFRDYRLAEKDGDSLRDERDRIVRDQNLNTLNRSELSSGLERDRQRRAAEFERERRVVPVPPVPLTGSSAADTSSPEREPARVTTPPALTPRVEVPRTAESPRETTPPQRIDDPVRSSADDARDRSGGTYRPAAGSNR